MVQHMNKLAGSTLVRMQPPIKFYSGSRLRPGQAGANHAGSQGSTLFETRGQSTQKQVLLLRSKEGPRGNENLASCAFTPLGCRSRGRGQGLHKLISQTQKSQIQRSNQGTKRAWQLVACAWRGAQSVV
jgi:hypothetical protein